MNMNFNILVLTALFSIYRQQGELLADEGIEPIHFVDLGIEEMNKVFHSLGEGESTHLENVDAGESYVLVARTSLTTLRVTLNYYHPQKEEHEILYTGTYNYHPEIETLIASHCEHKPSTPITPPRVDEMCEDWTHAATELIDVILTAEVKDSTVGDYEKTAECIKTHVHIETPEYRNCFLKFVGDTHLFKEALSAKLHSLELQGWICNHKTYECEKPE